MKGGLFIKAFRYKIDVVAALKSKNINTTKVLDSNIIGQSSMTKLRKGEIVGIKTLETLCNLLDCRIEDIIDTVDTVDTVETVDDRIKTIKSDRPVRKKTTL